MACYQHAELQWHLGFITGAIITQNITAMNIHDNSYVCITYLLHLKHPTVQIHVTTNWW